MTDDFGQDPQPPAQEHEPTHASSQEPQAHTDAETWADDQPPHDDFGATEETATVSHETAAEHDGEETTASETRQSRSMLPIVAGIGGILVLCGLIYWQFGGHSSSSTPPRMMSSSAPTSAASPPPPPLPMPPPPSPPSANNQVGDLGALYKPSPPSAPPASVPEPNIAPPPAGTTFVAPPPAASPSVPASVTPPQANPANPVPAETANNLLNPSQSANASGGDVQQAAKLNALSSRMDDIQKAIDQENKQFNQLSNMIAAQAPPTQPQQPQTAPALDFRLNKIEETLAKLETDIANKPAPSVRSQEGIVSATPSEPSVQVPHLARKSSSASSSRHRHVTHKKTKTAQHRKTSPTHPSHEVAEASLPPSKASPWVLRAATPKEAWVSGDATSSDLRHVQVGDNLPGVGVVRSITQSATGWQIVGTAGIVR